jgi:hypothetical protein
MNCFRSLFTIPASTAALLCMAASLSCAHRVDLRSSLRSAALAPQAAPTLLAVYQPWFGNADHIDVGYSSQDRVVLEHQIEQARNLGISGFLVNWYGPGKDYMDRSYALMQQLAAQYDFHVAIQYDENVAYPGHETDAVLVDLQYAYDRYIGPHAGPSRRAYLRYDGRPVIFIFPKTHKTDWSRVRRAVNSWQDPPLLVMKDFDNGDTGDFDGFYPWVQPGNKGWQSNGANWGEDYLDKFYVRMRSQFPAKLAVGAAWPGFNDAQASWGRHRYMDTRCGRTFEDSLRMFRRYFNSEHPLPFLLIETWNDYEEGTAIERGLDTCNGRNDGQKSAAMTPLTAH